MELIARTIQVAAQSARVLEAITTTSGFRSWWTDCDVGGGSGEEAVFRFGAREAVFRIDRIDGLGIELTCVGNKGQDDWQGTHLSLRAIGEGSGTRVDLLHDGYPEKNAFYAKCIEGWDHYLRSLRAYCESGQGSPWVAGIQPSS